VKISEEADDPSNNGLYVLRGREGLHFFLLNVLAGHATSLVPGFRLRLDCFVLVLHCIELALPVIVDFYDLMDSLHLCLAELLSLALSQHVSDELLALLGQLDVNSVS